MSDGTGEKKYSVSLVIPKSDKDTLSRINAAIKLATEQGVTGKFGGKIPPNIKLPLRDGDKERADDETYAGSFFLTASTKNKPGIVDKNVQPILDQSELYSGCYGKASINFYPFNQAGSKGVACGLNHLQKIKDGDPLGNRSTPEADFAPEEPVDDLLG